MVYFTIFHRIFVCNNTKVFTNLKKIIPIFLITIISLNSFGFDFIAEYLIYKCRETFEESLIEQIDKSEIIVFDYNSIEKCKFVLYYDEIEYDGQMYDIVRKEEKNNSIYFYCINDKIESSIKRRLNKETEDQKLPSHAYFIQKNIVKIFIAPSSYTNIFVKRKLIFPEIKISFYKSVNSDVISPPPNFTV